MTFNIRKDGGDKDYDFFNKQELNYSSRVKVDFKSERPFQEIINDPHLLQAYQRAIDIMDAKYGEILRDNENFPRIDELVYKFWYETFEPKNHQHDLFIPQYASALIFYPYLLQQKVDEEIVQRTWRMLHQVNEVNQEMKGKKTIPPHIQEKIKQVVGAIPSDMQDDDETEVIYVGPYKSLHRIDEENLIDDYYKVCEGLNGKFLKVLIQMSEQDIFTNKRLERFVEKIWSQDQLVPDGMEIPEFALSFIVNPEMWLDIKKRGVESMYKAMQTFQTCVAELNAVEPHRRRQVLKILHKEYFNRVQDVAKQIKEAEEREAAKTDVQFSTDLNTLLTNVFTTPKKFQANELPKIERMWREWRDRYGERFDKAVKGWRQAEKSDTREWPARCVFPRVIADILKEGDEAIATNAYSFYANYRRTKAVWKADMLLVNELQDLQWPGETPSTALLQLPYDSGVISQGDTDLVWWFDAVPYNIDRGEIVAIEESQIIINAVVIGLVDYNEKRINPLISLPIHDDITLTDSFGITNHNILSEEAVSVNPLDFRRFLNLVVNLLLYAAGNEDLIEDVGHKVQTPSKVLRRAPRQETVAKDYSAPKFWNLGIKFGRAIKQFKDRQKQVMDAYNKNPKRSMPPHIRRAHPHLYWTGVGRTIPIVRFIPPTPVKMLDVPEEIEVVTAQRVV